MRQSYTFELFVSIFQDVRMSAFGTRLRCAPLLFVVYVMSYCFGLPPAIVFASFVTAVCVSQVLQTLHYWEPRGGRDKAVIREGEEQTNPFLMRRLLIRPHHIVPDTKVWQPKTTVEDIKRRAFCTVGTTTLKAIESMFTWSIEYRITALLRIITLDLGLIHSQKHTAENTYLAIINTSMACFVDSNSGHLETYNTSLPSRNGSEKRHFYKIIFELDHELKACPRARLIEGKDDFERIIDDPVEVGTLVCMVGAFKTHTHVHYFANGVAEAERVWPLAQKASDMVQALNYGAVFSTSTVTRVSSELIAEVLAHNVILEGLPFHRHLSTLLGKESLMQNMSLQARGRLMRMGVNPAVAEAIISATIMHSADHYYFDSFLGHDGRSNFLEIDLTIFRNTLIGPIKYSTQRLLCRQHLDDPICQILYESCRDIDSTFADEWLFMCVAN